MSDSEKRKLFISDHALVRYMERIKGVCLDEYRDEIRALVETHKDAPAPAGGIFDDGMVIIIETLGHPVVTTVLGSGQRPKRKQQFTRMVHVPQ